MEVEEKLNRYKETFRVQAKESSVKKTVEQCKRFFMSRNRSAFYQEKNFCIYNLDIFENAGGFYRGCCL